LRWVELCEEISVDGVSGLPGRWGRRALRGTNPRICRAGRERCVNSNHQITLPWLSLLKLNPHWQAHFTRRTSSHEYLAGRNGKARSIPLDVDRYCQARVSTICTFTRRSGDRPRGLRCSWNHRVVTVQLLLNFLDHRPLSSLPRSALSLRPKRL